MKVIHFSTEKYWRGGEQQIAYLINELNSAGIQNYLICRAHSKMHAYAVENKLAHHALSIRNSIDLIAIVKTAIIFRKIKADYIHLHTSKAHSIALFSTFFHKGERFILHRRVSFTIKRNSINLWKYKHSAVKKIICISKDVRKQVEKLVDEASKMEVIYSGIDLNRFKKPADLTALRNAYGIPADHLIVTGVGALSPEKDFETFIKAAKSAREQFEKVHFLIVGEGKEAIALKALVLRLGMGDKITFTGFKKEIPSILLATDVFMLCSSSEGLGTSFIDAAAAGCPLIGTYAGGIPEIIQDGVNGFLATVGDHTTIGNHLIRLLNNEPLRKEMSEKAKESAVKFSIETMGQKYIHMYKKLKEHA